MCCAVRRTRRPARLRLTASVAPAETIKRQEYAVTPYCSMAHIDSKPQRRARRGASHTQALLTRIRNHQRLRKHVMHG